MMRIIKSPVGYQDRYEPGAIVGATKSVAGITGCLPVLHGVQGCTVAANHFRSGGPVAAGNHIQVLESSVGTSEVIQGANEELIMRHIRRYMERRRNGRPGVIFIFTSCATSIIEDDIDRVSVWVEEEFGIPTISIDTASFLGGFNRGAEFTWCAVLDRFGTNSGKKEGINLVGPQLMGSKNWPNDVAEIERLLRAADVEVNHTLFRNISAQQLPDISKARVNYILCGEDFADFDKKAGALGMQNWGQDLVLPVGLHNTEEWYLSMAKEFGNVERAKAQLKEDWDKVNKIMQFNFNATWALNAMFGKHIGIIGYAPFVAAMARCAFYDFNLRPVVIGLYAETPKAIEIAAQLLEPMSSFLDFEVLENPSYYIYGQKIKEARVEFSIGTKQVESLVEGLGIPHCGLAGFYYFNQFNFVPWPYFGVLGMLNLTSELWKATERVLSQPRLWQLLNYQPDHQPLLATFAEG